MFTLSQLKSATGDFRRNLVVGVGGSARVYKGWIDPNNYAPLEPGVGMLVAVKRFDRTNRDICRGLKECQAKVVFLGNLCHPNLVKLLGYCCEDGPFLLGYEYMNKGSLESHLFKKNVKRLPWETRIKIAREAARGLGFLHTAEKQVIYGDFKASKILLDEDFNAKLSGFDLARLGPIKSRTHITTSVVFIRGYTAPEYAAIGHLSVKSDVYAFGVVLLEILTGLRVLDHRRPTEEQNLVKWAMPVLPEMKKLKKIMDPRLGNKYPLKAAFQAAKIVLLCLETDPQNRPSMEEISANLEQISDYRNEPERE